MKRSVSQRPGRFWFRARRPADWPAGAGAQGDGTTVPQGRSSERKDAASLQHHAAVLRPVYSGLDRFVFLLGGSDGEPLCGPAPH
jgi:hypothetical protein